MMEVTAAVLGRQRFLHGLGAGQLEALAATASEAVRDRCAADPDLGHELTRRMFRVLAGRLQDTTARLIARSVS